MNSQFTQKHQQLFNEPSSHLNNSQLDEIQIQFTDTQIDRSRQRYLFQQKNNKLQQSHHGDSEIQENSINDGTFNTLLEMKQQVSSGDILYQTKFSTETNNAPKLNQEKDEKALEVQIQNVNDLQQEIKQQQNSIESVIFGNKVVEKQQTSNDHPSDVKSISNQDQTNMFASQNLNMNDEKISQVAQNNQLQNGKRKNVYDNDIWLQDDIFYEKNFKKLGTKVAFKFKEQQQQNQDMIRLSKYKQNYLKATHIINKILNTSVCRVVRIRQHVQSFVDILKLRHFNKRTDDLNDYDYRSINDLTHFHISKNKKIYNFKIILIINCFERFSKVLPIFMPTDLARVIWDMFQVIFTYSFLYLYSLLIFFDQVEFSSQFTNRLFFYSFIIFLVDIAINLNTAIFNKDTIIIKRKLISKQYFLSTIFITDFLSLLVLSSKLFNSSQLTVQNEGDNLFKYGLNILIFLKLNGISQKKKRFDNIYTLTENQKHIIKLINQIASVITAAHIAAIGWYFLGIQEMKSNQTNWLDKLGIQNNAYYEKYVYSIYWSITTMTTAHEQKDRDKQAEDKILSVLSNKLRREIITQINETILNSYFVLSSNFSKATLGKLLFVMEEVLVNPNEVIISEQEQDDSSIYFIQNGIIEIYQQQIQNENKVNVIKVLRDGCIFGELSFFSGLKRQASARSVNLSTLYKIRRDQFIEILKENVEDFERFKMIQDQIVFQKEVSIIHIECYNCKSIGHLAIQCPRVHRFKDQQLIILRQNYSVFQERAKLERNRRKKIQNAKIQYIKNREICNILKLNLKQQNDQRHLLFNTYEELFTSEQTVTQSQNEDDEDENSSQSSQISSNLNEQSEDGNSKILQHTYSMKKTDQILKFQQKTSNISQVSILENQCQTSQEKVSENDKSLSNQESQEFKKDTSNVLTSEVKINSFEVLDNFNINNPNLHFRKKQFLPQHCKSIQKNDQDYLKQNALEIQNLQFEQEKDLIFMNSKKLENQRSYLSLNNQFDQQQLDLVKSLKEQIFLQNIIFSSLVFENRVPQQLQQYGIQDNICKIKDYFDNLINQKMQDKGNQNLKDDNQKINSIRQIKDQKEKRHSNPEQHNNHVNKQNMRDKYNNRNSNQLLQQQQLNNKAFNQNNNFQCLDKVHNNIQDQLIPLIIQSNNPQSFFKTEPEDLFDMTNQFDRVQHFKRYFPHNNFQKVNQMLKKYQLEQKKLKKNHIGLKQRRQNIVLQNNMNVSIFQGNSNFIRLMPQDYNINQYKPTYLSYGVKMQKGNEFPKNFNSLPKN
ncbi:hypothetical protein ABPG73_008992 [Tetrahymena malaccensis]